MKCIIFAGDVGGGKTSHSHLLLQTLYLFNKKGKYGHVKSFHIFSRLFLIILLFSYFRSKRLFKFIKFMSPLRILTILDINVIRRNSFILSLLNLIDIIILTLVRQYLMNILNKILIFEDHIIGYLNDLIYFNLILNGLKGKNISWSLLFWIVGYKFLLKASRKCYIFFLYSFYNDLMNRYSLRGSVVEYPEYIAIGRVAAKVVESHGLSIDFINTANKKIFVVHRTIVDKLIKTGYIEI